MDGSGVDVLTMFPAPFGQLLVSRSAFEHLDGGVSVDEHSEARPRGRAEISKFRLGTEKQDLLNLVRLSIDKRDISPLKNLPRSLDVAAEAVACSRSGNGVVEMRCDEVGNGDSIDAVSEGIVLTGPQASTRIQIGR